MTASTLHRAASALASAAALALLASCAQHTPTPAKPAPDDRWIAEARGVAAAVPPKLLAVLQDEMARSGPEGAIEVCRDKAPAMARAASEQSGWQVRRVSLRNRNPKAVPDAWERAVLEDFDRKAAAGVPAAQLERAEVVTRDGTPTLRYMRALPVGQMCIKCHGPESDLSPAVKARLAALYPADRATGYRVDQIRGAMTLARPLASAPAQAKPQ